jgi:murein L,D-transpeptidase YcbB/YkuD
MISLRRKYIPIFIPLIIFLCAFYFHSCRHHSNGQGTEIKKDTISYKPVMDLSLPGGFSDQTELFFDSTSIDSFFRKYPKLSSYQKEVNSYYRKRNYRYAWYDDQGLIEQAGNLYNKLSLIHETGLNVQLPYETELHRMMDEDSSISFTSKAHPSLEILLTVHYFFYAKEIWTGLGTEGMKAVQWDLPRKKVAYDVMLDSLLKETPKSFLQNEPVYPQYAFLKEQLRVYRKIQEQGGWSEIKSQKKSYKKGDSSEIIVQLRKRLVQTNDLQKNNGSFIFDQELEDAVKQFQQRHGLDDDGAAGKSFFLELNVSVEARIEQIIVNMERCRWMPVSMNKDYFLVNIPEFRFHAFEQNHLAWSMNVIVGKSIHQTAVFSGTMRTVVFAPYWNVPPGILHNEILPAIRRNSNYLAANHMEWYNGSVRQIPGPWNALGKVKFLFPNSHNIYLHDTPAKELFKQDQRTFSHGCIRVEQPKRLTEYVLREQKEWTKERIDSAMNGMKELQVTLTKTYPVLIAYFTSWVDEKGRLNFRKDIYNKDHRLAEMIYEQ